MNLMPTFRTEPALTELAARIKSFGIPVKVGDDIHGSVEAALHDRGAPVPALVVSPQSEWGVAKTLELLHAGKLYDRVPVSLKSGGHGYFNGASCTGIMINLGGLDQRRIENDIMTLQPGCILAQTIDLLARHRKAIPHGDCFGVAAGGHFLTAGWDYFLSRHYGLGCQSVVGGRIVLWDGSILDVDADTHPRLLHAMRGGAAAEAGVVTEIRLAVVDEPVRSTWCINSLSKDELALLAHHGAFARGLELPTEISIAFRMYFMPDQRAPTTFFNVFSLLTIEETLEHLRAVFPPEVMELIGERSRWSENSLMDLRLIPASETLAANPGMLAEATASLLQQQPLLFWEPNKSAREMGRSFMTSISHWIRPACEQMMVDLYEAFEAVQDLPVRNRMDVLAVLGGGRITQWQDRCAMPLGQALSRFEMHWDKPEEEEWAHEFTDRISAILLRHEDPAPGRTYRGDIWRPEQAQDPALDRIREDYDRRFTHDEPGEACGADGL